MKKLLVTATALIAFTASIASAATLDMGVRYGRTLEEDGGCFEVAARYFPIKFISLGGSVGYSRIEYNKGWYSKKVETTPIGGYINAHLPLPLLSPYAGIGGISYPVNSVASPHPSDNGTERSGTMTMQGGVDVALVPLVSMNIEVRRLVDDQQTMFLGGLWVRF